MEISRATKDRPKIEPELGPTLLSAEVSTQPEEMDDEPVRKPEVQHTADSVFGKLKQLKRDEEEA
jgi:hypothetical protein